MNPLSECCIPHSAPIPHQFVMKVYVDAWIYVTEKFVNMGNIELYEGVLRYEKADYPPIPGSARHRVAERMTVPQLALRRRITGNMRHRQKCQVSRCRIAFPFGSLLTI